MNIYNTEKIVILGSGPAALTAAIYLARSNLNPLVIEGKNPGGQLMGTSYIENWPGTISILGSSLILNMKKHALHFGTRFLSEEVTHVNLKTKPFIIQTHKNSVIKCQALIIATGATPKKLNCPGEDKYWSKGVTTCAVCDGTLYKNKKVIIVGGGDTAMENASFMTNFTNDITIVHILPKLTASYPMQQKILKNPNIHIIYESTISEILGNESIVTGAIITNQNTGEKTNLKADAIFISIGLEPNTKIFKDQLELTPFGYIVLKENTQTSIEGVFAAGDVSDSRYRQAITSAGFGCAAALDSEKYLKNNTF